jgi:hypothetical protein
MILIPKISNQGKVNVVMTGNLWVNENKHAKSKYGSL